MQRGRSLKRLAGVADESLVANRRSFARRRLRKAFWQYVRESRRVIVGLTAGIVLVVVTSLTLEPWRFVQGFLIATVSITIIAAFGLFFLMYDGNFLWLLGAWAEDFVNDEIAQSIKRNDVWGAVRNIEIGGFDIDHLVVAPGGVFAIETKSHSSKLAPATATADREQALRAARKAASVLRSMHVEMPHDVTPVLAILGKRATATLPPEGRCIEGVHCVAVANLCDWLVTYRTGRLAQDNADTMLARLSAFKTSRVLREPVLS